MNTQQNKKLISRFFSRFTAGDIAGALEMMTDDATWWIAGKPGTAPFVGTHSKEQIARLFRRMGSQLKDGLRMTVKGMTAEGERLDS